MELIEQDCGLRCVGVGGVAKRLPHVHHGEPDARALLIAKPLIALRHAGLRAVIPAEPDRAFADEVADHDPVFGAFANRYLIDADHRRRRRSRLGQLGAHVLFVQFLHGMPIQLQLLGNIPDRSAAAAAADVKSKSLGIERVVCQELQTLALHLAALAARNPPHLELQEDTQAAGRKISNAANLAIVPTGMFSSARPAGCFFERRTRVTMRACGSPNMPRTSSTGRKPANRYASSKRRRFVEVTRTRLPPPPSFACEKHSPIRKQIPSAGGCAQSHYPRDFYPRFGLESAHTTSRRAYLINCDWGNLAHFFKREE